jgi:type II secretory pathway component GspD/PulD (secretin)
MKILLPALCLGVFILAGCGSLPATKPFKQTWSSFDLPSEHPSGNVRPGNLPPGTIDFSGVGVSQVLEIYQKVSRRTVVRGSLPEGRIQFRSETPLTQIQVLQILDTLLAEQGVAMIPTGETIVRAVPVARAISENPPEINLPWRLLPESKSVMTRTVQLKNLKPSQTLPVLAPLAGLPNSIMAIDDQRLLILRDYSINIRRQLQLLEELEQKSSR